jgi:hypothetical protein
MNQVSEQKQTVVELFGGAIESSIPLGFKDASLFREIPDNQEVFVGDEELVDYSIVFDIMEMVNSNTEEEAAQVHLEEITVLNGVAGQSEIVNLQPIKVPSLS